MAKPRQYCKVISIQLIKINEKNIYINHKKKSWVGWGTSTQSLKYVHRLQQLFSDLWVRLTCKLN